MAALYSQISIAFNFKFAFEIGDYEMEKWQKERNYKRIRDKNGNVLANIITVSGRDIAVSDEVFDVYSGMDRRARYISEDVPSVAELSLEGLIEDGISPERLMQENVPSAEDICIEWEDRQELTIKIQRLSSSLTALSKEDHQLLHALFFDGVSVREYARKNGLSHTAVRKRRDKLLQKIKIFLEQP